MKISLNDVAPSVPWNLTIEIEGVEYPIRPWELRDTEILGRLPKMPGDEVIRWVESLFAGGSKPDVRKWDEPTAQDFMGILEGYRKGHAQKKVQAVAQKVRRLAAAE